MDPNSVTYPAPSAPETFALPPAPLRVLYLCHDGDLYGSQQSLLLLLENLPQAFVTPFVSVARPGPLEKRLQQIPGIQVLRHKRLQWVKHDPRNPWQHLGDQAGLLAGVMTKVWPLVQLIKRHRIQLVHTNSMVSLEGALAARLAGVPHVWHIRELFMAESPKLQPTLGRATSRTLIHQLSQRVFCISNAVRDQFGPCLAEDANRYVRIYNALPPEAESPLAEPGAHDYLPPRTTTYRIGYIGRLSAGKRFQDLVAAMARLVNEENRSVDLLVAGHFVDEPFRHQIDAAIAQHQLGQHVHFLGYQTNLSPLYQAVDLLVIPSLNEPFGRVVIEAMRAGVPCVAANSGGIPEIVTDGDTGRLFPPTDVFALCQAVGDLLDDAAERQRLRENAGRMVRTRFTIEAQVEAVLQSYRQLTAAR